MALSGRRHRAIAVTPLLLGRRIQKARMAFLSATLAKLGEGRNAVVGAGSLTTGLAALWGNLTSFCSKLAHSKLCAKTPAPSSPFPGAPSSAALLPSMGQAWYRVTSTDAHMCDYLGSMGWIALTSTRKLVPFCKS